MGKVYLFQKRIETKIVFDKLEKTPRIKQPVVSNCVL